MYNNIFMTKHDVVFESHQIKPVWLAFRIAFIIIPMVDLKVVTMPKRAWLHTACSRNSKKSLGSSKNAPQSFEVLSSRLLLGALTASWLPDWSGLADILVRFQGTLFVRKPNSSVEMLRARAASRCCDMSRWRLNTSKPMEGKLARAVPFQRVRGRSVITNRGKDCSPFPYRTLIFRSFCFASLHERTYKRTHYIKHCQQAEILRTKHTTLMYKCRITRRSVIILLEGCMVGVAGSRLTRRLYWLRLQRSHPQCDFERTQMAWGSCSQQTHERSSLWAEWMADRT